MIHSHTCYKFILDYIAKKADLFKITTEMTLKWAMNIIRQSHFSRSHQPVGSPNITQILNNPASDIRFYRRFRNMKYQSFMFFW